MLVGYDAAAGYTTASGYIQGVTMTSKTYFSHTVRYTGGSTPTGAFEIHGNAAASLTSSAFEYLVVQGATGTFRGTGTLTNGTPVMFLGRGIDNKSALANKDKVRIKLWNTATNAVIHDSQPNAVDLASAVGLVRGWGASPKVGRWSNAAATQCMRAVRTRCQEVRECMGTGWRWVRRDRDHVASSLNARVVPGDRHSCRRRLWGSGGSRHGCSPRPQRHRERPAIPTSARGCGIATDR